MGKISLRVVLEGVIVALLVGVAGLVVANNRELGEIRAKVDSVDGRIERIADALPGIGAQIAYEGLLDPFQIAFLVRKPFEEQGKWYSNAFLLNAEINTKTIYRVPLKSADDVDPYHLLFGYIYAAELKPMTTIKRVEDWSITMHQDFYWPDELLKDVSFVSRVESALVEQAMAEVGFVKVGTKNADFGKNWHDLATSLKAWPRLYQSP